MSRTIVVTTLVLVASIGIKASGQDAKAIAEAKEVIAIYTNDWGRGSSGGPKVIASVWGDGSMVWSKDSLNGGPPYFTAKLKPDDVAAVFKSIDNAGAFEFPKEQRSHFGPDSQFTTILVRRGGKELKLASWHELYEANGKLIAAAHGLTGLDDRKLIPALAKEPAEYLHFRMTWLELRLAVANLIPKSGNEIAGAPVMLHGELSWQPPKGK